MALDEFLHPWSGVAYRHIPAGSPFDILDFRFAGRGRGNRWNDPGLPTLYLARDHGVAIAEFARHLQTDRAADPTLTPERRQIHRLSLSVSHVLDLREQRLHEALSLTDAPQCFLDRAIARATARYLRTVTPAQGIVVPSAAFIDDLDRWVLVLFLDKLPDDPHQYIHAAEPDGTLRIDP